MLDFDVGYIINKNKEYVVIDIFRFFFLLELCSLICKVILCLILLVLYEIVSRGRV